MKSLKGHFLVASPRLADSNFYRSVVLMVQHDAEGAMGLVLNRQTSSTIAELWHLMSETECPSQEAVFVGGPVSGPLLAVHSHDEFDELEILPGVYFATDQESVVEIVTDPHGPFRLFVGYSGWSAGQLEGELEAGGWLIDVATREDVFSDHGDLWNRIARRIGLDILAPTIKNVRIPDDPSVN
jgi:putative transcriptional regulator